MKGIGNTMKIYIVTGDWFKMDDYGIKDYDTWVVKAFSNKDEAIEFTDKMNDIVFLMKDYQEGSKYDDHLDLEYLKNGDVEYMFEECELAP